MTATEIVTRMNITMATIIAVIATVTGIVTIRLN
jgi:hypothetical protein